MKNAGVDAFLVPSQDPHFSEYVATCYERRAWVSNFTGSAGTALVTRDEALLWTDGRYFLQAEKELGEEWTLMRGGQPGVPEPKAWLRDSMPKNSKVGVDANVHSLNEARALRAALEAVGSSLVCVETNPVDEAWGADRPEKPTAPLRLHAAEHAGKSVEDKLAEVRERLKKNDADYLVVSPLDEVAWLFNVRGGDAECNPVAIAYGLVGTSDATLYVDERKVSDDVRARLVTAGKKRKTAADDADAADAKPPRSAIKEGVSPIPLAKAVKNEAELKGMLEAHLRDGVAMASFWCWLDAEAAAGRTHDEHEIGTVVSGFRAKQAGFIEESFATIAGEGPHGAIIHYRASKATARDVTPDSLLLCDSGGQYDCGTTDVTRTHHTGTPTAFQKEAYTRVLQGHIGLSTAVFPIETSGFVLDAFARRSLWQAGLDYRHGTGHGVGAALNVHEGPQSISPRFGNPTGLLPGMILSNEPGYYEDGGFGIRIENLLVVKEAPTSHTFGDKKYLMFEPLTFIPIQKKLIDWSLMSGAEVKWLNEYHARVWELVSPRVEDEDVKAWLREATNPVEVKVTVVG
ncbi:uncharacterized protein MICPUCDRAFT_44647 [Micromonas pusilla CCMP1545]|uniref:Predicted protein n=1 Tax=Micromonas pusilla (strain CCMP1545) TaxID=564608 RepID=C1MZI6_MICPC|nr:uncharacterized protein MICPUCDRAFT_44647 [Micromonas pusilla CCMP1545]EEH54876.1 predicted protein [Micromonas pusilla CCMP1545]|eukprot:XP_003061226.1 predicted protein [Micromonas pusilla CCMP1545]